MKELNNEKNRVTGKKKGKLITLKQKNRLFEEKERLLAEIEYEKYYNRIKLLSRGGN